MKFELELEGECDLHVFGKEFLFCFVLDMFVAGERNVEKWNRKQVICRFTKP